VNDFSFHHQTNPSGENRASDSLRCYNSVDLHKLASENFGVHISVLSCGGMPVERRTRCESYVFGANGQVLARPHTRSKSLRINGFRTAACGAAVSKSGAARISTSFSMFFHFLTLLF
jgi:hypothetical protein